MTITAINQTDGKNNPAADGKSWPQFIYGNSRQKPNSNNKKENRQKQTRGTDKAAETDDMRKCEGRKGKQKLWPSPSPQRHQEDTYSAGWAGWRPPAWSSAGEAGECICSQNHSPEKQHTR